jgi:hypothetical protein
VCPPIFSFAWPATRAGRARGAFGAGWPFALFAAFAFYARVRANRRLTQRTMYDASVIIATRRTIATTAAA